MKHNYSGMLITQRSIKEFLTIYNTEALRIM